ncbi:hypothetical protein AO376_1760 [Moraxella catarrhalis]|nr:hypothetical protein AO376_1760 [Moraxella catarrhalis]OAV19903.1 hypothetical protein AO374_0552 [Moraxella catarrhalis]
MSGFCSNFQDKSQCNSAKKLVSLSASPHIQIIRSWQIFLIKALL